MKFLFVSESRHLYQDIGAVQLNTHELALELVKRGHSAIVASELKTTDFLGFRTRMLGKFVSKEKLHDRFLGYPTYRRWNVMESLSDLIEEIKPDIVVVQPRNHIVLALELARMSVPRLVYFHDANPSVFHGKIGNPSDVRHMICLSNSKFTAQALKKEYEIDSTVIRPIIHAERFKSAAADRDKSTINVTVVDPQVQNGVYLPIKLASSCPDIPICFLRAPYLPKDQERVLKDCARMYRNLTVQRQTRRMDNVFGRAKCIVIPGNWDADKDHLAWQAHSSGIPVVASNLGTLPEVLGPGDILLDPDGPVEAWIEAVRRLWNDESYFAEHSAAAIATTTADDQIGSLLELADKAIRQQHDARHAAAKR